MIDLFSRKVVGWNISSRMRASTVCNALHMAMWQRRTSPGLIVHSDRGSQLKEERVRWRHYQIREEARQDILDYIVMFYNSRSLHSTIGYVSPNQFEKRYWGQMKKTA